MGAKGAAPWAPKARKILCTLRPNNILKPNPNPNASPNAQPSPNPTRTPTPSPNPNQD